MKKIISTIICISLLSSIICIPVSATEDVVTSESIDEFCEDVNEMVTEYSDSEFVTPDFIEAEQILENIDEEIEINYCPRLIVQSDKPIDTYNAVDVVSGFINFYIVQFENEKDTNYAYEQYKSNPDIISVEYDISYNAIVLNSVETAASSNLTYEDYKKGWYLESTGMDRVLEKCNGQNLPEVVVAVVDSGVDLNCKYLQDRLIPKGFNNAGDGVKGSEQDYHGHGTMVSSVIANCTTDNVKITNYRCSNSNGYILGLSLACTAILQAVNDGADVINCSFIALGEYELMLKTLEYAYSQSVAVFSAVGNYPNDLNISLATPLSISEYVIAVGSHNKFNTPSGFTAYGKPVDVLAPGEEIPVITLNNIITTQQGTSFAAPFMASVYAMFLATHSTIAFTERFRAIKNCGSGTNEKYATDYFGSGIANPLELFDLDLIEVPKFSLNEGKYVGEISLELFAEKGATIYYTTDQTYPTPTNGTIYSEPIKVFDSELCIRAVAYKDGNRSNYISKTYNSVVLGTDDMFTVNENGVITEYIGNVKYLKIPEVINGITVTEISSFSGFDKAELYGVILPDTVEFLGWTMDYYDRPLTIDEQVGAFNDCKYLEFIVGNGIKTIGYYGFAFIPCLYEVCFPNCEEIMCSGFYQCGLIGAEFPKVKRIDSEAFYNNGFLREIYLPSCEEIGSYVFNTCPYLTKVYAPKATFMKEQEFVDGVLSKDNPMATNNFISNCSDITTLDLPNMESIGQDFFTNSATKIIELSNSKYIFDLPNTIRTSNNHSYYGEYYFTVSVELSLPSTLQYCVPATDYKNEYIEYVVYGTAGVNSYAEQWAKENNIEFVNISQETAIVEDIEPIWDTYSYKPLEFDARGFNRTYQWYGSTDKIQRDSDDKLISGATDKTFNPDNCSKSYPYYYCVMTSTDVNIKGEIVSSVDITSSMCENRRYYMFAHPNTHIDFDNKLIYTKTTASKDFLNIIGIQENTSYSSLPSLVYKEYYWYGTGSEFVIYNGTKKERYTLIVEGDVDGDSAVDVLDAYQVSLVVNGHTELTDGYFLAADTNSDEEITVEDYAQVVNLVLAS